MKILVADKLPEAYVNELKEKGNDVTWEPKWGEADIAANISDFNAVVVRSTKVNADAINASTDLKLVIRAGAGYNNINVEAATAKGVHVCNTPGKNSIAVAELAIGHMVNLDRKISDNVADLRNGVWNKAEYSKAEGLYGKTLAIIGVGNIGREVAKRAAAFGMTVYGRDIVEINDPNIIQFEDLAEVLPKADVVSLHLPATPATKGMINDEFFGMMKKGAFLINTSRAEVVNEDSLLKAAEEKGIRAALDVFADEPEGKTGEVSTKLAACKNIYITHHIGASTNQAQLAVAEEVVKIVDSYTKTGEVLNCVNK